MCDVIGMCWKSWYCVSGMGVYVAEILKKVRAGDVAVDVRKEQVSRPARKRKALKYAVEVTGQVFSNPRIEEFPSKFSFGAVTASLTFASSAVCQVPFPVLQVKFRVTGTVVVNGDNHDGGVTRRGVLPVHRVRVETCSVTFRKVHVSNECRSFRIGQAEIGTHSASIARFISASMSDLLSNRQAAARSMSGCRLYA